MKKVGLLSIKEIEVRSQGIPRYISELYNNCKKFEAHYGINVQKVYFKYNRFLGDALSFEIGSFSNPRLIREYKIIHIPVSFFILHNVPKDIKIVTTVHDLNPILVKDTSIKYIIKDRLWRIIALRRSIKYNINRSDYIITDSTQTRDEVVSLGIEKNKIKVINLGLDNRFITKNKAFKNSRAFVVGYIGSFAVNKNVKMLIETAKKMNKNNVRFDLWGFKSYNYEKLVEMSQGCQNINFKGFASEESLVNIYDSFSAFVFPSFYEGFGLPILEAQSRGLPVIIYKYGKIPKEVRKYCFEAESPEHMAQIIEHLKENGYNEKERKRAMEYARSFTWERTAKETLKVYRSIIK